VIKVSRHDINPQADGKHEKLVANKERITSVLHIIMIEEIRGSHTRGCKEFCLLGYNALYSVENQPTFRKNLSPTSSGLKNKPCKKPL
jgi:hypothetical protein